MIAEQWEPYFIFLTENLIKLFTINKFCTRNLQSIWYTAYMSLLFSIAWVELIANSTCHLSCLFSLFLFLSLSAHPQIFRSLLPFTGVSCCFILRNHTQNQLKLHHSFFDTLIRNTPRIQCSQMRWLHGLSTRKNEVAHFNWMNDKNYECIV